MSDISKKKDEAKKGIRALLISTPRGLTLGELKRDHLEFFGTPLPGKEFGYNSAQDFLQDLPDVVDVKFDGGTMILKAVADSTTKHIEKMVSRQKIDTKKKWAVSARQSSSWSSKPHHMAPSSFNNRPPQRRPQNNNFGRQHYNHYNRPPRFQQAQHRTVPSVPSYVQNQIHDLVFQHREGLPLTHFSRIFRSRHGVNLDPHMLGFQNEYDLLASIPNIVSVRRFEQDEMRVLPARPPIDVSQNIRPSKNITNTNSKSSSPPAQTPPKSNAVIASSIQHESSRGRSPSPKVQNEEDNWDSLFNTGSCNIPDIVQRNVEQLISSWPGGIKASNMLFEYKNLYKIELPMKTYGYNSVIEFVSDLSHIIRIERPNKFDWILYPVKSTPNSNSGPKGKSTNKIKTDDTPAASHLSSSFSTFTACHKVEPEVKEAISQVLGQHPKGIPLGRFLETFKEMTNRDLDLKKYGTDSVKGFLHSLSDILYIMLDASDQPVVCSVFDVGPRRFDHLQDKYKPITPLLEQESDSMKHGVPPNAVTPGCFFKPQPVTYLDRAASQSYIELYVSFTTSPGHFWIQIRGQRTTLALEDLMDALEVAYGNPSKEGSCNKVRDYHMTKELAKPGMVCAVIYPEDLCWHRGIITGHKDNLYEVFYVDYGNTCYLSLENIRFLKTKFLTLPAQAIRARLSNIQPVRQTWPVRARQRFLDLTKERPMLGFVTAFKNRILSLCLTDTSGTDDIHINDLLTYEGYAKFEPDQEDSLAPEDRESCSQVLTTDFLYGDQKTSESTLKSQKPQAGGTDGATWRRYVRQAQMSDDLIFNLINLGGEDLYVMSSEISAVFFEEDIISAKLRKDKTDIPKVVVTKDAYPDLYAELLSYEVSAISESTSLLSLFPLKAVPLMMEMYGKDKNLVDVKDIVLEVLDWFDPNDPYWKGEDDNSTESGETDGTGADSQSVVSDSKESFKMEDLNMVLKMLQMKRNRSLKKLLEVGMGESKVDEVNTLNQVEIDIRRVESLIESLERKKAQGKDKTGSSHSNQSLAQVPTVNTAQKVLPTSAPVRMSSLSQPSQKQTLPTTLPTSYPTIAPITATVAPMPHLAPASMAAPSSMSMTGTGFGAGGVNSNMDMGDLLRQQMAINSWLMTQIGMTNPVQQMPSLPLGIEQLQQQQVLLQHQQQQLMQQKELQQQNLMKSLIPPTFPTSSVSLSIPSSAMSGAPGFSNPNANSVPNMNVNYNSHIPTNSSSNMFCANLGQVLSSALNDETKFPNAKRNLPR